MIFTKTVEIRKKPSLAKRMRRLVAMVMMSVLLVGMSGADLSAAGIPSVLHAQAASVLPHGVNHQILQAMINKMGGKYTMEGDRHYDCSNLVKVCMNEVGFAGVPITTADWRAQISEQSLHMTYNGVPLEYIYCDTIDYFKQAMENVANEGKVIVLKTMHGHTEIEKNDILREGAMEITNYHISTIVAEIPTIGLTGPEKADEATWHDAFVFGSNAYNYLAANYEIPLPFYQVGDKSAAKLQKEMDGYVMRRVGGKFIQCGRDESGHDIWGSDLFTVDHNWANLVCYRDRHGYGQSHLWRMEAASTTYGVAYTNKAYRLGEAETYDYVVYLKENNPDYYQAALRMDEVPGVVYALVKDSANYSTIRDAARYAADAASSSDAMKRARAKLGSNLIGVFDNTKSGAFLSEAKLVKDAATGNTRCVAGSPLALNLGEKQWGYYKLVEIYVPKGDYKRDDNVYRLAVSSTSKSKVRNAEGTTTVTKAGFALTKATSVLSEVGSKGAVFTRTTNSSLVKPYKNTSITTNLTGKTEIIPNYSRIGLKATAAADASQASHGGANYLLLGGSGSDLSAEQKAVLQKIASGKTYGSLTAAEKKCILANVTTKQTGITWFDVRNEVTKAHTCYYIVENYSGKDFAGKNQGYWKIWTTNTKNASGAGSSMSVSYYSYDAKTKTWSSKAVALSDIYKTNSPAGAVKTMSAGSFVNLPN